MSSLKKDLCLRHAAKTSILKQNQIYLRPQVDWKSKENPAPFHAVVVLSQITEAKAHHHHHLVHLARERLTLLLITTPVATLAFFFPFLAGGFSECRW